MQIEIYASINVSGKRKMLVVTEGAERKINPQLWEQEIMQLWISRYNKAAEILWVKFFICYAANYIAQTLGSSQYYNRWYSARFVKILFCFWYDSLEHWSYRYIFVIAFVCSILESRWLIICTFYYFENIFNIFVNRSVTRQNMWCVIFH